MTRTAFDFETHAIDGWKAPVPVGVAINAHYYAFGHPTQNNCSFEDARNALANVWDSPIVAHNAPFDIKVAMQHFGLPYPKDCMDTLVMAYLDNPHAPSLALKWLAKGILHIEADEQAELNEWIKTNVKEVGKRKDYGAFIAYAPGELVGRYANSDTKMTDGLLRKLSSRLRAAGMEVPLRREMALQPVLAGMTARGIRVDRTNLEVDLWDAQELHETMLKEWPDIDIGSPAKLGKALIKMKLVDEKLLPRTPTGQVSTAGKNLLAAATSPEAKITMARIGYTKTLGKLIGTYMEPWLRFSAEDGHIHPNYSATRNDEDTGTRTGRLACADPNVMNVSNEFKPTAGLPPLPIMRQYLLPPEGAKWMVADFSGQEPRLAAHFAGGSMRRRFNENPRWGIYEHGMEQVKEKYGVTIERKPFKTVMLGLMYGMGKSKLAQQLGVDDNEAAAIKKLVIGVFPELKICIDEATHKWKADNSITTLGGRVVKCQPPTGQIQWDYKAFNMQIQGSAADQTKSVIIDFDKAYPNQLLTTVHDEVDPWFYPEQEAGIRECLSELANKSLPCSVPMLMDFVVGDTWNDATD